MPEPPEDRSHSRNSFYSTTTYHSFQDIELYDSERQSDKSTTSTARTSYGSSRRHSSRSKPRPWKQDSIDTRPSSFQMVRQDSGYESSSPVPRSSTSVQRRKRNSQHASSPSPSRTDRTPTRPALRRRSAGGSISHMSGRSSLSLSRSSYTIQQQQNHLNHKHSYFQFPSPEHLDNQDQLSSARPSIDLAPVIRKVNSANANPDCDLGDPRPGSHSSRRHHIHTSHYSHHDANLDDTLDSPTSLASPHVPPQTTHYWTSDRTRRLEYAAIDAASRGVRGWIMRNVVPDCFVPKATRRVCFDDDSGSVRRYRLDLEVECPEESVPPSPVGEKLRGFRARDGGRSRPDWWAKLRRSSS